MLECLPCKYETVSSNPRTAKKKKKKKEVKIISSRKQSPSDPFAVAFFLSPFYLENICHSAMESVFQSGHWITHSLLKVFLWLPCLYIQLVSIVLLLSLC
jgi:hypothetical protein